MVKMEEKCKGNEEDNDDGRMREIMGSEKDGDGGKKG